MKEKQAKATLIPRTSLMSNCDWPSAFSRLQRRERRVQGCLHCLVQDDIQISLPRLALRKRKATTEACADNEDGPTEKDSLGATGGTTSRRAKRVASSTTTLRNDENSQPMLSLAKNATRGFRTRKS